MKRNIKLLSFLALSFVVIFGSCKPKDDPSPEDQKIEELSGTWDIVSAEAGADVLEGDALSGVSITFTVADPPTYSVTELQKFDDANLNHSGILSTGGTFSLNENLDVLSLDSNEDFNIISINKENGDLTLSYESPYPKATEEEPSTITLTLEIQ